MGLVASAALCLLVGAGPASAAGLRFRDCPDDIGFFECTKLNVPIDRDGSVPGSVGLFVSRLNVTPKRGRNAVFVLAGGPGQSAVPFGLTSLFELGDAIGNRDLVLFDQRGTGRSGVLRCPSLEGTHIGNVDQAVKACATAIGPRRRFYTTWDSAQDIEAVRRELGLGKLTLMGVSYGTKLALTYARLYPGNVERLVLDSVVPTDGPDPLQRPSLTAIPRVLGEQCADEFCNDVTRDPTGDLTKLVGRLAKAPIAGNAIGDDGKPHVRHLGRLRLLDILYAGDFDPQLRAGLPGAVQAGLRGDSAPLLRLSRKATRENAPPDPRDLSIGLFFSTVCEEGPLPWSPPELSFNDRWKGAIGAANALPESAFAPFDRQTAAASAEVRFCAHWPATGPLRSPPAAAMPGVPVLTLSGQSDLRTPAEGAAALAATLPHATNLSVPGVGHSVVGSDLSGCAQGAVSRFLRGKPVTGCDSRAKRIQRLLHKQATPPTPIPPLSLDEIPPPPGVEDRAGRILRATEFAFIDAVQSLPAGIELISLFSDENIVVRVGGLRAGRALFTSADGIVRLRRYSYVPGVEVSGKTPRHENDPLRLVVRANGGGGVVVFDLKRNRIRGRLAGERFNVRGPREFSRAVRSYAKGPRKPDGGPVFARPRVLDDPLKLALDQ